MFFLMDFRTKRALMITSLQPNYQNLRRVGNLNNVGKTCLVRDCTSTTTAFTAEVSKEIFKIQNSTLNCDCKTFLDILKCKTCCEVQ